MFVLGMFVGEASTLLQFRYLACDQTNAFKRLLGLELKPLLDLLS